ncbi:MAG: amidohydrolase [Microbacteriaceae bacterium]
MPSADLVLRGGPVFTGTEADHRGPDAPRAVAVRDGVIVAVGAEADELITPSTEVVDLAGGALVPGFQDAHVHPVWGGLDLLRCSLADARGRDEVLATVATYAAAHPDDEWILGGGWSMSDFAGGTPLAADLDRVAPGRAVFLVNRDGHGAWASSVALERAGIHSDTTDPADGRIERADDGTPSGTLHEGAMGLVNRLLPEDSAETMLEALMLGQSYLHSFGITAWQDAAVGGYGDAGDPAPAYLAAATSGALTARVVGALWFDRERGLEQIPELLARRKQFSHGRFSATSVKIMQDGVAENFTAAMIDSYLDGRGGCTHNHGISFISPEILHDAVPELDKLGFQVHFHAIGDRAVRECLDAIEEAQRRNGSNDNRHHIAHLQVVHPDDVHRFAALGVTANMQSLWAALEPQMIDLTLPFLGDPRSSWQYPFGDLHRSGAHLAAGSDWSVSTPNPLSAMHVAVNRRAAPGEEEGVYDAFLPHQALDIRTAMLAYTSGSARVNHLEATTGTIEVGKLADLVALDHDPTAVASEQIGEITVKQTFVNGIRVYDARNA